MCCRCSPTQKAEVVRLIQLHTGRRTAAVGDGGNDVSMIQAADAGTPSRYPNDIVYWFIVWHPIARSS